MNTLPVPQPASVPSRAVLALLLATLLITLQAARAAGRPARGQPDTHVLPVAPGTPELRRRLATPCPNHFRTLNGMCTNDGPGRYNKLWGSSGTAHFSYVTTTSSVRPTRRDGPSARLVSNLLSNQPDEIPNRRGITEFFVFFGEFLDHNFAGTAFDRAEDMDIPIPDGDHLLANFSALSFKRSARVGVLGRSRARRAMNSVSSAIDLSPVYGSDARRLNFLRGPGCRMKTSRGRLLPLNSPGLMNEPSFRDDFFLAGDIRANDHPVLTSLHTIFLREHNLLCRQLQRAFPYRPAKDLFEEARKLNIAQFQKIVFEEFYPTITGQTLPPYLGYQPSVNPATSDIFSTAAYRIGHTLVGNSVQLRGARMRKKPSLPFQDMFFRPAANFRRYGLESFVLGAIDTLAQEVDELVSKSLRDFLFTNVKEFKHSVDLIALNIQRGRDHALPDYNSIRKIIGLKPVEKFSEISSVLSTQSKLSTLYDSPDEIDPWVGMMCEDHVAGSSMGMTVRRVWELEFSRFRDGDRFHYAAPELFSRTFVKQFPKAGMFLRERNTMKRLLLDHSAITLRDIPGAIFRKGGKA